MRAIRLTRGMRDEVLKRLMAHAFDKRTKELEQEDREFADAVYKEVYPSDVFRKMRALPEGFLKIATGFSASFAGQYTQVDWAEERRISETHSWRCTVAFDAKHPLSVRFLEIARKRGKLREDKDRARAASRAALDSCSSVKQLTKVWPEAAPFVKDFALPVQTRALTISVKDLNAQLGLGKK